MTTVFRKKKRFQKKYEIFDTAKDFGMQQSHKFAFAADPSKELLFTLLDIMSTKPEELGEMGEDELIEMDEEFFRCVSELTIDSDVEGLDFSTPETAKKSFTSAPEVDWHFMYQVFGAYITTILTKHQELGKVLAPLIDNENSGSDNGQKELQSKPTSGRRSSKKPQKKLETQ